MKVARSFVAQVSNAQRCSTDPSLNVSTRVNSTDVAENMSAVKLFLNL